MSSRPSYPSSPLAAIALLTILASAGLAQAPAPTLQPQRSVSATAALTVDAELERLAGWMTGSFDTFAQVAGDQATGASYTHLRAVMHIVPARIAGLEAPVGSRAFYVEQAAADALDKPYRQRVYLLARRDGVLWNRIYKISEPSDLVGAAGRPDLLASLPAQRLTADDGCDVVFTRVSDALYTGITGLNNSCKTTWRGADHAVSQILLTPTSITSLDQGFDTAGARVWGPPAGTLGHVFTRRGATLVTEQVREFARLRAGDGSGEVIWYAEGTVYTVKEDGSLTPSSGLVGFNVARAVASPGGDIRVLTREVFVTTDIERRRIATDRPPLTNEITFGIGVRDGKALAGIAFTSNGRDLAAAVPPVEILSVATESARRFFTVPLVNAEIRGRRYWALESYEFVLPPADRGGEPRLIWQRDTERPEGGRVHYLASGRRFTSLDAVAASSPIAAELVKLVRAKLPAATSAP